MVLAMEHKTFIGKSIERLHQGYLESEAGFVDSVEAPRLVLVVAMRLSTIVVPVPVGGTKNGTVIGVQPSSDAEEAKAEHSLRVALVPDDDREEGTPQNLEPSFVRWLLLDVLYDLGRSRSGFGCLQATSSEPPQVPQILQLSLGPLPERESRIVVQHAPKSREASGVPFADNLRKNRQYVPSSSCDRSAHPLATW